MHLRPCFHRASFSQPGGRGIQRGVTLSPLITTTPCLGHPFPKPFSTTQVRNNGMSQLHRVCTRSKRGDACAFTQVPTTERSHNRKIPLGQSRCLNSSSQHVQTSSAGRGEQRPLCVCHCFPVLNLRGGGRVTTFSIKRKVIEIHFQEGTQRPHGGVEPLIKPTQVGCQHPTARGRGWGMVTGEYHTTASLQ